MAGGDWKEMISACEEGNLALVKFHLQSGIDPNYAHPEFLTFPIIESVRNGNIAITKLLLENGASPTVKEGFTSETALSLARNSKNFEAIRLLNQYLPESQRVTFRNVLITGGNRGIGQATAQSILNEGHRVVITTRNQSVGESVIAELKQATGNKHISLIVGDLSTIKSSYELARRIKKDFPKIDTLVHNAGIWSVEKQLNKEGLEMSFMVNYLARYILTTELLPTLEENQPTRIVNVNAGLYSKGKLDVEQTPIGGDFHPIKTYANSKLCEVLFTIDLAERLEGTGVSINAVHPGVINTGLGDSPKLISKFVKLVKKLWKKPYYGAIAPTWLAVSDETAGFNGLFFNEKEVMKYIEAVQDKELRKQLEEKTKKILNNQKV